MLEPGDLFLSFIRGPGLGDDDLPRLGVWQSGSRATPRPADLNDAGRDWIAALGVPAVFRQHGATRRSEHAIRAGMTDRVVASGDELDTRMKANAERHDRTSGTGARRTRGKENLIKATLALGHSIEGHIDARGATQGHWALDGIRTDVDLLLAAVADERWDDARRILEVAAAPAWGAPIDAVDISRLELPSDHVTDETARRMLGAAIKNTAGRPARRRGRRPLVLGLVAVTVLAAAMVIVIGGEGGREAPSLAEHYRELRAHGKVLVVSNLVTSGRHMTEDRHPAVLTGKPVPICCALKGSERRTGDRYDAAVCQIRGPYNTNGNDNSKVDDNNPGLAMSNLYYGVLLSNSRFGFTSAIWIEKSQRRGLGLPRCEGDGPP